MVEHSDGRKIFWGKPNPRIVRKAAVALEESVLLLEISMGAYSLVVVIVKSHLCIL